MIVKLASWSDMRRVRGELLSADDDGIAVAAVEIDGVDLPEIETHTLSYDVITKARTHFDWGPTPKKGGSKAKSKGGKNQTSKSTKSPTQHKSSNNKRKKR